MTKIVEIKTSHKSLKSKLKLALSASASALTLTMFAQPTFAQSSDEDVVEVTGSRQVIQDAIALKRNNTQIVDGLSADEIGDIPALSIGEALENITGVASHRENGGATEVSIRGLGPYLSSTVVNGRAATNGSGDRSVNFSQFPSELMNKLAVFKTQDASQIEGGVAGQIQLETIKPLDYGKRRVQFEVKGNVNPDQLDQKDTEAGDIGYRFTGSYTDQFELGNGDIGFSLGLQRSDISQPEAESRSTGPTSSSRPACLLDLGQPNIVNSLGTTGTSFTNNPGIRVNRGETEGRDDDCDDVNDDPEFESDGDPDRDYIGGALPRGDTEGYDTSLLANGVAVDSGSSFAFAPSQRHFRQNDTRDQRDAIFGAVQWAPNDRVDVNLDAQWSERIQSEQRSDLTFNGGRRSDTSLGAAALPFNTTLDSLQVTPSRAILYGATDGNIEIQGGDYERKETYLGGGINLAYDVTDRLAISADYGYSKTERNENNREFRIQSDRSPVIVFDRTNGSVPQYGLYGSDAFDVNDPTNFVDRLRVRIDNDVERENTINSARFDATYDLGDGFFKDIEAGVRWGQMDYVDLGGGTDSGRPFDANRGRFSFEIENDRELTINNQEVIDDQPADTADRIALQDSIVNIIGATRDACYNGFVEGNSFLSSQREGDLVTIYDDNGDVVSSNNSWAQFDAGCVADTAVDSLNALLGDINALLVSGDSEVNSSAAGGVFDAFSSDIPGLAKKSTDVTDVRETTKSFYLMTNYGGDLDGSIPISGNIGVRVVQTDVEATGYRSALIVNQNDDGELTLSSGDLEAVSADNSYTKVLPSANFIMEVADDKVVRLGAFRAMSRADPADMGFSRGISSNSGDDENPITTLEALIGNVSADGNPEIDPLMSWNYDASFEYYPNPDTILAVGAYYKTFQGGFENIVQNETYQVNGSDITRPVSVQQTSDDDSQLFGIEVTASHGFTYLPGLLSGLGAKISYNYVDSNFEFEDSRYGDKYQRQLDGTLIQTNEGIIAPAGLPGLSENTLSAQIYYGIGGLDLAVNYKYRDNYFQPFTSDGTRLRYIGEVGVWEARASYEINDNFRVSAEIINIGSAPKEQFAFVEDDLYEVNDYGPRVFFGLRGRF